MSFNQHLLAVVCHLHGQTKKPAIFYEGAVWHNHTFFLLLLIGFFVYYISFLVCDEINNFCSRKIQVLKVKKLMTDGPQCK